MANEWQIEAVSAEVITRATITPAQIEQLFAEVALRAVVTPAQVENVYADVATPAQPTGAYVNEVLADAPLAWWRQNDPSSPALISEMTGRGRHATAVSTGITSTASTVTDSTSALTYNGVSYGNIPTPSWATGLGDFTAEAWFNTSMTGNGTIIGMDDINQAPGNAARKFNLYITGGLLTFMCFTSTGAYPYIQSAAVNDAKWHHVAATRSGVVMTLYVDGAQVATTTQTGVTWAGSSVDLTLAAIRHTASGPTGTNNYFVGTLDELALYGSALSSARVNTHYTQGAPAVVTPAAGFTGWGRPI